MEAANTVIFWPCNWKFGFQMQPFPKTREMEEEARGGPSGEAGDLLGSGILLSVGPRAVVFGTGLSGEGGTQPCRVEVKGQMLRVW